jgi:putative restriction endonuclease
MATGMIASPNVPASVPGGLLSEPFVNGDILYEVVDNEVRELPPMSARETLFASTFIRFLSPFSWDGGFGQVVSEMLFLLSRTKNLQRRPDLAFVSFARWPRGKSVPSTNAWEVVPDLAIEVISPTNGANEVIEKIDDYFASGVRRVWVIYPSYARFYDYDSATSVRILTRSDILDGAEVLPGFQLPLSELFEIPTGAA